MGLPKGNPMYGKHPSILRGEEMRRKMIKECVKVFTVVSGLTCFGLVSWIFWGAWFHGSKATVYINNHGEAQVEAIVFIILIPVISLGSYWLLKGE